MRAKAILRCLLYSGALIWADQSFGQASVLGNAGAPTDYLGWDNTNNFPLPIRHDANQPIDFYTDALQRMRLQETATYTIGSFPTQTRDGALLLCPDVPVFIAAPAPGPYSLLHVADNDGSAQQQSYRPWMRVGLTLTGNKDHSYIGQKATETDYTDMVVHWSDNPGKEIKDRLRFLFTSAYNAASTTGADSEEGLEGMRLWPKNNDEVHVGIGDFYAANIGDATITEPTERVDMVNGRLRVRDLPDPLGEADGAYKVMVVDDTTDPERGVVKWVAATDLPAGCDWTVQNAGTSGPAIAHNVWTAVGTNNDCPDVSDAVGIGTDFSVTGPQGKLDVRTNNFSVGVAVENTMSASSINGLKVTAIGGTSNTKGINIGVTQTSGGSSYGVEVTATGAGTTGFNVGMIETINGSGGKNYGFSSTVSDATAQYNYVLAGQINGAGASTNTGVKMNVQSGSGTTNSFGFHAELSGAGTTAWGVHSEAIGATGTNYGVKGKAFNGTVNNYGVYGEAAATANNWAGYFAGNVQITGNLYNGGTLIFSDPDLKTNIETVSGSEATDLLTQLTARSYQYSSTAVPQLDLPSGDQFGFLETEVGAVLPQLVGSTTVPAEVDSAGNVIHESAVVGGVNYIGMIPLLVAGFQEAHARAEALEELVAQQSDQLASMQAQLNSCCTNGMAPQGTGNALEQRAAMDTETLSGNARALTIQPNPFNEATTLFYTLERAGRMQLLANSADGKELKVLDEAQREAGQYQYNWNTIALSPGVYYVTLLLDGEPIVKKAVRVRE